MDRMRVILKNGISVMKWEGEGQVGMNAFPRIRLAWEDEIQEAVTLE